MFPLLLEYTFLFACTFLLSFFLIFFLELLLLHMSNCLKNSFIMYCNYTILTSCMYLRSVISVLRYRYFISHTSPSSFIIYHVLLT